MKFAWVLLVLVFAAPAVSADLTIVDFNGGPNTPVPPGQPFNLTIHLEASCDTVLVASSATQPATAVVDLLLPQDKVLVTGNNRIMFSVQDCVNAERVVRDDVTFQLNILREAVGLSPISGTVSAHMEPGTTGQPIASTMEMSFSVTPSAVFLLEASATTKLRATDGGKAVIPVDITNFGNSPVKVLIEQVSGSAKLRALDPVLLDPPGGPDQSRQVALEFGRPSGAESAVELRLTPQYQYDAEKIGEPVTLTVLIRDGDSLLRNIPAPPLLPAALVALGLLAARRRDVDRNP